jgi:hypothetical protein
MLQLNTSNIDVEIEKQDPSQRTSHTSCSSAGGCRQAHTLVS